MNWSQINFYRLSRTKPQEMPMSKTSVDTRTLRPQPLLRKPTLTKMVCLQKKMDLVKPLAPTHLPSKSLDIRERVSTQRVDQETFTTHQVKSLDTWPSSPTTTTFMATTVNSTLWSKSSRLKCASITSSLENVLSNNSASSLTGHLNSDSQMT